eukprot:gene6245-biopygen7328
MTVCAARAGQHRAASQRDKRQRVRAGYMAERGTTHLENAGMPRVRGCSVAPSSQSAVPRVYPQGPSRAPAQDPALPERVGGGPGPAQPHNRGLPVSAGRGTYGKIQRNGRRPDADRTQAWQFPPGGHLYNLHICYLLSGL